MHFTVEKLLFSREPVQEYFTKARDKWKELLEDLESISVEALADELSFEQIAFFEKECGGRWAGQEVMAWSAFGYLYTTADGFGDKEHLAVKLAEAFQRSMVSLEVKSHANRAAKSYHVGEP